MIEIAYFIENKIFKDKRGTFSPLELDKTGKNWVQSNISVNPRKYTLRGLHFQKNEYAQAKLIKVISGKILDFVVDLRMVSDDYNKIFFFELNEGDELLVPRYFAHGFITTEDNTVVQYLVDNDYSPENEGVKVWTNYPEIKNEIKKIDPFFREELIVIADKDLLEK
jgi:dTDP-4-dehydrorhamnose 3,5-epimerase